MRLSEIAQRLNLTLLGRADVEINEVTGLDDAGPGALTFIKNKRLVDKLKASGASAVITAEEIKGLEIPQLLTDNPLLGFARALELFYKKPHEPLGIMEGANVCDPSGVSPSATVYPGAYLSRGVIIGDRSIIYPNVYVGENVTIGEDTVIFPNVTIMDNVSIGSRVRIHSSTVIGSDGFGYVFHEGRHHKIPQIGKVIIEDDVEIGAGVTIDRATTGVTLIGEGTKIDNLVQIAHNVKIGKHCIVVAQVGIAGSTVIGNYVTLAGQVGVADHARLEDGTIVTAQSGISNKEYKKGIYSGTPAIEHGKWLRASVLFERLPEMEKRLKRLEKLIEALEEREEKG
ncbi:MAG: UDP-3-O-(3-hydroxymyristoyl)glucosamine N-acyltransferase [Nitrospirae bacterium]|nr:MAG: UDP-3-O-(3-hydroxymyristoyl)glucosamine N-acyltransferase [Nitrospirota bacterium]